jgi:hypothetical protein
MTLTELVRPEGFDCACGKHHACPMDYLKIGLGAIQETAAMVKAMGSEKPFVVCDKNTYEAAGKRVDALLTEAGIPHTWRTAPGGHTWDFWEQEIRYTVLEWMSGKRESREPEEKKERLDF